MQEVTDKAAEVRAVTWAGLLWTTFTFPFLARATGVREASDEPQFTVSSGSSCPFHSAYVRDAGQCTMYAQQRGIDKSFPVSEAPECCLRTGDKEVNM